MRSRLAIRHWFGGLALLAVVFALAGCRALVPQQDQYEEELYLALDGSATHVRQRLRPRTRGAAGAGSGPGSAEAPLDRRRVRELYESPVTHVTRSARHAARVAGSCTCASTCRTCGGFPRRIRLHGPRTGCVAPATSTSTSRSLAPRQGVTSATRGGAARKSWRSACTCRARFATTMRRRRWLSVATSWCGSSRSRIGSRASRSHIEVRIDIESILYRTLWLFGVMIVVVVTLFAGLLWWIVRKGRTHPPAAAA